MPMDLKALQKEEKFILTQRVNFSCYLFSYYQRCHFQLLHYILKKKITGSRKIFPVVISSTEDLSDDGGL